MIDDPLPAHSMRYLVEQQQSYNILGYCVCMCVCVWVAECITIYGISEQLMQQINNLFFFCGSDLIQFFNCLRDNLLAFSEELLENIYNPIAHMYIHWFLSVILPSLLVQDTNTDLKKYWMPDKACKECSNCSVKFGVFIRRHHCRICGRTFCHACCSMTIPGEELRSGLQVRRMMAWHSV